MVIRNADDKTRQPNRLDFLGARLPYLLLVFLGLIYYYIPLDEGLPPAIIDEGILLFEALSRRGLIDSVPIALPGYPPLILGVSTVAQWIVELWTGQPAINDPLLTIIIIRFFAMLCNIATMLLIYRSLVLLHSRIAGFIGALAWLMIPAIFAEVRYALTEPFHIVMTATAILMLVKLMHEKKTLYALLATLFGVMAVVGKYPNFPVLGLGVGGVIALMIFDDGKWWRILVVQTVMIGLGALILWFFFGASEINSTYTEMQNVANTNYSQFLGSRALNVTLSESASLVHFFDWRLLAVLLIAGSVLYLAQANREQQVVWIGLGILSLCLMMIPALFLTWDHLADRYVVPSVVVNIILFALLLAKTGDYLAKYTGIRPNFFLVALGVIWLASPTVIRTQDVIASEYPNTLSEMIEWSEVAIPGGTTALPDVEDPNSGAWLYFDRIWAGYRGPVRPWVHYSSFKDESRQEWLDLHIRYLVVEEEPELGNAYQLDLDELLLIKQFPVPSSQQNWTGTPLYIYQLWQPAQSVSVDFGGLLRLSGYDATLSDDNTLTIEPYWKQLSDLNADYQYFIHVTRQNDPAPVIQADLMLSRVPSSQWDDPDEIYTGQVATLALPEDWSTETYDIFAGIYDPVSGQRLMLDTGDDRYQFDPESIHKS